MNFFKKDRPVHLIYNLFIMISCLKVARVSDCFCQFLFYFSALVRHPVNFLDAAHNEMVRERQVRT